VAERGTGHDGTGIGAADIAEAPDTGRASVYGVANDVRFAAQIGASLAQLAQFRFDLASRFVASALIDQGVCC
jgi:hypothetical protein